MIEFQMPSLGADMEAGTLREWLVKPGDKVKKGDVVAVVDTQKGLIDIEVFDDGVIDKILIREDEKVPVGTVMAMIENGRGKEATPSPVITPEMQKEIIQKEIKQLVPSMPGGERIKASPLAKRIAEEKGIDLHEISGSGESGAIVKEDIENYLAGHKPSPVAAKTGASADTIRSAVAAAMSKSNREIPHYYVSLKADMSRALDWLAEANKKRNVKQRLLPAALLLKAVAMAIPSAPELNGFWEDGLISKKEIHIGFVVSLRGGGVMIPAIPDADKKSMDEIMAALNEIIPRARNLKMKSSDFGKATITVTSLGEKSSDSVFGVIYPPQVALVGFGGIHEEPWAENGMLAVRPVVNISLAADHRATDGTTGSRFLTALQELLQKPESFL